MNNKVVVGIVFVVFVILGYVGYMLMNKPAGSEGQSGKGTEQVAEPTTAVVVEEVVVTGETKEFTVEGSDFAFAPTELRVKAGDTVVVNFKNMKGFHDFVIDEFEVKTSQIGAEDEEEVEFVASKKGTFEYYCSVGQHRKNGMVGKLIVE